MRIAWVHPHAANPIVCSARVNARIPAAALTKAMGWETQVVSKLHEIALPCDVVVCMAIQDVDAALSVRGHYWKAVIAFQSDGEELSAEQQEKVDAIVCDSEFLRTKIAAKHWRKTVHIYDALEVPLGVRRMHPNRPLKLAWVGAQGNFRFAEEVVRLLGQKWSVEIVTDNPAVATTLWSLDTAGQVLGRCDVGLVPYPQDLICESGSYMGFRYKDNCRSMLFHALGMPVVASILPAHLQYITHGKNGLIANRPQDWVNCIEALQDDPVLYACLSARGLQDAEAASPERVGKEWAAVISYAAKKLDITLGRSGF